MALPTPISDAAFGLVTAVCQIALAAALVAIIAPALIIAVLAVGTQNLFDSCKPLFK